MECKRCYRISDNEICDICDNELNNDDDSILINVNDLITAISKVMSPDVEKGNEINSNADIIAYVRKAVTLI